MVPFSTHRISQLTVVHLLLLVFSFLALALFSHPAAAATDGGRRRANTEYWRIKGNRLPGAHRRFLGFIGPRNSHEQVERQRSNHRSAVRAHYHSEQMSSKTFFERIGFAD